MSGTARLKKRSSLEREKKVGYSGHQAYQKKIGIETLSVVCLVSAGSQHFYKKSKIQPMAPIFIIRACENNHDLLRMSCNLRLDILYADHIMASEWKKHYFEFQAVVQVGIIRILLICHYVYLYLIIHVASFYQDPSWFKICIDGG